MLFRLPVRRFVQGSDKIETPSRPLGALQWVLSRPLYRFQTFDLSQVPAKNRTQALSLELTQWTPFAKSAYYIGWYDQRALVWGWDANKVDAAIMAQGLKPQRVRILPETLLQTPHTEGLCISRCHQGFEGQLWRQGQLDRSRWWPQLPSADEWLMFQRDAAIAPSEQQHQTPAPRVQQFQASPWLSQAGSSDDKSLHGERLGMAAGALALLAATLWYGTAWYKAEVSTSALKDQLPLVQSQVEPLTQARSQALDYLARANVLRALAPYPAQLTLMAKVAQALPKDKSFVKEWDFKPGQLKITVTSATDISTTTLISQLQQISVLRDVKALPGRDPKVVTFQMEVAGT